MKHKTTFIFLIALCLLSIQTLYAQSPPPPGIDITYPTSPVNIELYDLFEVQFDLISLVYDNPYDPNDIEVTGYFTSPTGEIFQVPGFYYQDIQKNDGGNPTEYELLETLSTFNWRLRFTPTEVGSWSYYLAAVDLENTIVFTQPQIFNCTPGNGKGFIRKADSRYLKYDDGTQYFPVGTNLPRFEREFWWSPREYGTNSMKEYIDYMYDANINHYRLEINFFQGINLWGIDLTDNKNYYKYFNPKDSWQLDETIEYAASKGITISLAINSWQDMGDIKYSNNAWTNHNPYHKSVVNNDFFYANDHAGNCDECWEIYTDPEAIQVQKNLMRYIIARWAYATNVLSLIVWDEANQVAVFSVNQPPSVEDYHQSIYEWHIPMIEYIKEIDPFDHLVNSGNAGNNFFKDTDVIDYFDFYQGHVHNNMAYNLNMDYDWNLFDATQDNRSVTSIPSLIGEFSYLKIKAEPFTQPMHDPKGYGFHSVLWTSLFNGSFGTSMHWAINYLKDLFPGTIDRYKGVGYFVPSLPKLSENLTPHWEEDNNDFRLFYLSNNNNTKLYGWMQDENFRFGNILSDVSTREYLLDFTTNRPTPNENKPIYINVTQAGDYTIEWYETTGELYENIGSSLLYVTPQTIDDPSSQQLEIQLPTELHEGIFADGTYIVEWDCEGKWHNSMVNGSAPANVRANSNLVSDNYGQVIYVGDDNKVWIMWNNGSYYQSVPILQTPVYDVRVNSGLAIDDKNRIYYIAEDNLIHRLYFNHDTELWEEEILLQNGNYQVRENSNLNVNSQYSVYFVEDKDDKIYVLWLNEETYNKALVLSRADEVASNSLVSADHKYALYYIGRDDLKMHKLFWDWNTEEWDEIIIDQSHITSIRPFSPIRIRESNNRIYYIGNDNKLHEKRETSPNYYVDAIIASNINYSIQNTSGLEFDSDEKLYFTSNNLIHRTYWDQSSGWIIEEIGESFPQDVNEYLCINNNDHIFYKGNDSRIHVDFYGCDDNYRNNSTFGSFKSVDLPGIGNKAENGLIEKSVHIYPNPATQNLNVSFDNLEGEKHIKLLSARGIMVSNKSTNGDNLVIDVSNIEPGLYILIITNKGEQLIEKIVVE